MDCIHRQLAQDVLRGEKYQPERLCHAGKILPVPRSVNPDVFSPPMIDAFSEAHPTPTEIEERLNELLSEHLENLAKAGIHPSLPNDEYTRRASAFDC